MKLLTSCCVCQVRPPVEHGFGCGALHPGAKPAKTEVFQHRLLQHFQLSIFCKLPVQPLQTIADLRRSFMVLACPFAKPWVTALRIKRQHTRHARLSQAVPHLGLCVSR